ncbi:MAG: tocopherol cyclase family protein [Anaerolineae bacterium]|nr:tocopherol cyclase family protein [Anaerolineae bacterium]
MIRRYIESVLHPERYHGRGKQRPFFEGWYYKLVDPTAKHRYAVIPGIFRGQDPHHDHAFVQVLDGTLGTASYHQYPVEAFQAQDDSFEVCVGPNRFCADTISLDIADGERTLQGTLHFEGVTPWPVRLTSPGVMGWYGWLPFMECYHGVVSFDHTLEGILTVDGLTVDFTHGRGYIEKDWGQAFPEAYIWMQSNHFEETGTSFTGSIAVIPWRGYTFPGFIVGLWHQKHLYRFATYTGAKVEHLSVSSEAVNWTLVDSHYRLELQADHAEGGLLKAPIRTEMHRRVHETMQSSVAVRLSDRHSRRVIYEGNGLNAGLEVYGDTQKLIGK